MMSSSNYLVRACPLCQTAPPEAREVATRPTAEQLDFAELVPQWNGFYKEKAIFSYARCQGCALLYAPRYFTEAQLGILYAQMPPNMSEVPIAALERTQHGYFEILRRNSALRGDYVEMGPDIGLFTQMAVRQGNFDKFWLLEPNLDVRPALERAVQGRPAVISHEMSGISKVPNASAGAAVMIHVLDHLLDPLQMLRELRLKMAPGSRLLLVTHDESSLLRRIISTRWPAFCLQHPQLYRPATMRAMLEKAGFDTIALERSTNYFRLDFLLKQLLWAFGIRAERVPSFAGLTLGLKLGNIVTVAAPRE